MISRTSRQFLTSPSITIMKRIRHDATSYYVGPWLPLPVSNKPHLHRMAARSLSRIISIEAKTRPKTGLLAENDISPTLDDRYTSRLHPPPSLYLLRWMDHVVYEKPFDLLLAINSCLSLMAVIWVWYFSFSVSWSELGDIKRTLLLIFSVIFALAHPSDNRRSPSTDG